MNSDDRWIHKDVKQFIELEAIKLRQSDTGWKAGWHPKYMSRSQIIRQVMNCVCVCVCVVPRRIIHQKWESASACRYHHRH